MAAAALEQSVLESKDKDTLLEMAKALGVKANSRLKKSDIIDKILDTTGPSSGPASSRCSGEAARGCSGAEDRAPRRERTVSPAPQKSASEPAADGVVLGTDGEPLADWEIALREQGVDTNVSDVTRRMTSRSKLARIVTTVAIATVIASSPIGSATDRGDGSTTAPGQRRGWTWSQPRWRTQPGRQPQPQPGGGQ